MSIFKGETPGRAFLMYVWLAVFATALVGPAAAYILTDNKAWFTLYALYLAAGFGYAWKRTEE